MWSKLLSLEFPVTEFLVESQVLRAFVSGEQFEAICRWKAGFGRPHQSCTNAATLLIRRNRQAFDKARAIAEKAANGSNNAMLVDRF